MHDVGEAFDTGVEEKSPGRGQLPLTVGSKERTKWTWFGVKVRNVTMAVQFLPPGPRPAGMTSRTNVWHSRYILGRITRWQRRVSTAKPERFRYGQNSKCLQLYLIVYIPSTTCGPPCSS